MSSLRNVIHESLSGTPTNHFGRVASYVLIALILLNVAASIVESVPSVKTQYDLWLNRFEVLSVTIFVLEYLLRVWACTETPKYARPLLGRVRFILTPMAIVDLLAVLPTLLLWAGVDLRFLRILRFSRIFRLAKLTRYSKALKTMGFVFKSKREELMLALIFMMMVLIVASSLMYLAEHDRQPEAFSSIPNAMWWGVMTLTTVGYGDVYPVTVAGKLMGAVIAVIGIGLFALPAGIIGSAFFEIREQQRKGGSMACPHCGKLFPKDHTE